MGEEILVALDAVGVLFAEDVAVTCQRLLAVPANKVLLVKVLLHGFSVLTREN